MQSKMKTYGQVQTVALLPTRFWGNAGEACYGGLGQSGLTQLRSVAIFGAEQPKVSCTEARSNIARPTCLNRHYEVDRSGIRVGSRSLRFVCP
jgi:hypothetical protein